MASLQVQWAALAVCFTAEANHAFDVPGLCPLCGSEPVASVVYAQSPYQGYRYLHCALCATEWHMVRVQCSRCGASGKSIAFQSAMTGANQENDGSAAEAAVRAETCEQCRCYRKILYQEKDPQVEPVADDLASLNLDLLLGQRAIIAPVAIRSCGSPTRPRSSDPRFDPRAGNRHSVGRPAVE